MECSGSPEVRGEILFMGLWLLVGDMSEWVVIFGRAFCAKRNAVIYSLFFSAFTINSSFPLLILISSVPHACFSPS